MSTVMYYICYPLGYIMKWCWELCGNYGLAIILFTLTTKFIILPLSVSVQKNSIKMVQIQPEINFLKAKYYGDRDTIAEEETKLYKRVGYSPFASSVPLLVQILLLMCVVYIIKEPLTHVLHIPTDICMQFADELGLDYKDDQLGIVRAVLDGRLDGFSADAAVLSAIATVKSFSAGFLGISLDVIPSEVWGVYTFVPVIAGVASLILCYVQNAINVLQAEQSKLNKYGMTVLSVGISLGLGFFVYSGVALYWVASNVFAIVQQYILNAVINPKKYVDYGELEKSRQALADIESLESGKNDARARENSRREKADYKRFFKIVNKHLVIYSERSGFYKYFEAIVEGLLRRSNIVIHYVTGDPDDAIFEKAKTNDRIKPYYVGQKRLITMMMKMDVDIVVMTTPDLENYYIKRSLMRKDVEYIYIPHDMMSVHMGFREGALDHFDTVFCTGPHVAAEVRETERVYSLPAKKLIEFGYPLTEKLEASCIALGDVRNDKKEILIAPSWQEDNLLDSCLDGLLASLVRDGSHVTVRPHPEYSKRYPDRIKAMTARFADIPDDKLTFELDFTTNKSIYSSDILITDWSGIAYEFAFATKKPVLFINTKMKSENPNWQRIPLTPVEISLRDRVGISLEKTELSQSAEAVDKLIDGADAYREKITQILHSHLYSYGTNGAEGVRYILTRLKEIQDKKKNEV